MAIARIGLDYTAAIHQNAGIGRYVRDLTDALAQHQDLDLHLFAAEAPRVAPDTAKSLGSWHPSRLSERSHNRLWHRLRLPVPIEVWTGPISLFHATDFALPPTLPHTRTVLTIHDLAFEHYPADTMPGMLPFLSRVVPRSARKADHIIAVSDSTRRDLISLYDIPESKITVVPHGVHPRFHHRENADDTLAIRTRLKIDPQIPIILTVGTIQPRKNHVRLVRAFSRIPHPSVLVIAGSPGWGYDDVIEEIGCTGLHQRVILTGHMGDEDLPMLYRAAHMMVYPALYEGFGLPVLESMQSGTPVITSTTSSLPEVAGRAALLVDPFDIDAIAHAIRQLLEDSALHASLRQRGLTRAREFSWARAADKVVMVYRNLL